MPDNSRKSYMTLIDNLEGLADGAKKHGGETGYPAEISETNIRQVKLELETIREQCVHAAAEASKQQEMYDNKEEEISNKVSRYKTMIYGLYGKKNRDLLDFGLKPYKERTVNSKNNVPATV
jgi:hypothetical protein